MKTKFYSSVLLLVGIGMLPTMNVSAQPEKQSVAQITLVPPVSTNGANAARYTNVFSFNVLIGISENEKALTFGSLANVIGNHSGGLQFAGLYNRVGNEGEGMLFSGLLNTVVNNYSGLQFAGLANTTKEMKGLQFAGLANVAGDVDGFQFAGLMNVAKNVSGVQFAGLINVAENSDCPIGLINLIKNGEMGVSVTYNEMGSAMATFRSGGKYMYGLLGLGYNFKTKGNALVSTGGIGARINLTSWLRINHELSGETISNFSRETTFRVVYALMPAFKISKRFEIFGGPTVNYMQTNNLKNVNLFPGHPLWKGWGTSRLQQVYLGYQVGVQIIL
ncbi:MAG: hypothetical protein LBK12_04985 [Odoribacteraceae bacterium]|nr:hypothetical protein [Odoribacteraceae bacterium]